jgi:hypothetical protein
LCLALHAKTNDTYQQQHAFKQIFILCLRFHISCFR